MPSFSLGCSGTSITGAQQRVHGQ